MPRNGSGVYAAPASSWNPAVGAQVINSTDWNALLADISSTLSQSLSADGQTTATARIPFAQGVRIAAGSDSSPSLNFTGALTTGLYAPAADEFGITVATTPVLTSDGAALNLLVNTLITGNLGVSGKISAAASATGGAGLNIGQGVAPTSPNNGDVWITSAGLYGRVNGATQGPYLSSGGAFLAVANNLSDLASASTARTNLGLGTMATQAASAVNITGGAIAGITDLAVADGGTGASTASNARTNLGLVIGTDVQAYHANLAAFAGLSLIADRLPYANGTGTLALATFTAAGRALVDDADASAQRTTLGLVIGTNVQAYDAGLASIAGLTTLADRMIYTTASDTYAVTTLTSFARTLLDDADAATARTTLGLGSIATQGSSAVTITGGSITGITDLAVADGGTGSSTASGARSNLGIGTIGTQDAGSVAITGGSIIGITDLAVADGGTGASDAAGARTNLMPSFAGNAGKSLVVNSAETDLEYGGPMYVVFEGQGSNGACVIRASRGVSAVSRTAAGTYLVGFPDLGVSDFGATVTASNQDVVGNCTGQSSTQANLWFQLGNASAGSGATDPTFATVMFAR